MRALLFALLASCARAPLPAPPPAVCDAAPACDLRAELAFDPMNCGACGNVCPLGVDLIWGNAYRWPCCAGVCVDVQAGNDEHCGSCSTPCAVGKTCEDWICK